MDFDKFLAFVTEAHKDQVDQAGKPDADLHARFEVRCYPAINAARVSVVVENCWDDWAGHVGYDAAITLGKDARGVYAKQGVRHRRLSRWRKVFWWPAEPPRVTVAHDLAYLVAAGVAPNYDTSRPIPETALVRLADHWSKADTDIMGNGSLTKYMPTTGGRPEIGPYPEWTAVYLRTMDPRAKTVVLGNADLAGSWPIHVRSRQTGRPMTLDDRPDFWINGYKDGDRYTRPHWKPDRIAVPDSPYTPEGKEYHLSPDVAHHSAKRVGTRGSSRVGQCGSRLVHRM